METKFKPGDIVQRKSRRNYKTASNREECKVLYFCHDGEYYVTQNTWDGVKHFALKTILEECFEKVC